MSDTVKIIAEVDREYYEIIKRDVENHLTDFYPFEIIGNGIPLDDVKAEIEQIEINGQVDEHTMFIRGGEEVKNLVFGIIDKHTK